MSVNIMDVPTQAATGQYTTGFVTAKDGLRINYRQLGSGPGMVLLHGAMESAQSHMGLAEALADRYTVYLPDRRGHCVTGAAGKDYSMQKEVDDLDALLTKTDTHNVFGVSAGGLIALQAVLTLPAIQRVAVYEPALIVNGSVSTAFLPRYERELAEGKIAAALITGMIGAQLGPLAFNAIPRGLLELMTTMSMKQEDKKARSGDVTMRMLAPTLRYDFTLVAEMAEKLESFREIRVPVLLLGGSKSPVWLKAAVDALAKVLPHVERVDFPNLDHGGSSDLSSTNRNGNPQVVAQAMRQFFAEPLGY